MKLNKMILPLLSSSILLGGCAKQEKVQKPNIIIILADDLGYSDPTCYSKDSKIPTPNIDKLAANGVRFTDAHSSSAVCTPTRYSILTGEYSWRTRLKKGVLVPWDRPLIEETKPTIARMLKGKGYSTAAIGKWHLGWNWPTNDNQTAKSKKGSNVDYSKKITGGPKNAGFDYNFGDDVPNYPPYTFIENENVTAVPTVDKPKSLFGTPGKMVKDWSLENVMPTITQKAVDFITKSAKTKDKPFFMYFALTAPHTPIAPLTQFKGKSKAGRYGDFVYEVDWSVGQINKALKDNGIDDNTIVIFTSDNGSPAANGENYYGGLNTVVRDYGHKPSAHLRGMKSDIWEGGHRIPFIFKWDKLNIKNKTSNALISSLDIMQTISEIVNDEPSNTPDGKSFLSTMKGENKGREYLVHHSGAGVFAIRKGDWKLILSNVSGGFSDFMHRDGYGIKTDGQLYNLKEDPSEKNNLYSEKPEKVKELNELLEKIKNK